MISFSFNANKSFTSVAMAASVSHQTSDIETLSEGTAA